MSQALRYLLVVGGAVVSILLFLLATASDNSGFFVRYYSWLLGLNAAVAVSLLVLVVVSLARLYAGFKSGKFGSKLMARLMLLFASIGILPGLVIFMVSAQFLSHSIESWFNVRIEAALESGLNLAQGGLDDRLADLKTSAQRALPELAARPSAASQALLDALLAQHTGMQNVLIVGADGRVLASARARPRAALAPDLPTAAMLVQAAMPNVSPQGGQAAAPPGYAAPEGGGEVREGRDSREAGGVVTAAPPSAADASPGLRLRVLLPIPDADADGVANASGADGAVEAKTAAAASKAPARFLQLLQSVPPQLAGHAEVLRTAYSEYKERLLARVGLRKMYFTTLTLTLLLAIFGAIAASFIMAGNLAQPLLLLAEGTRAVAEGDLSPRPIVASKDELGTLTQSFNIMTRQLFEARSSVERNRAALQNAKAHLESVLANMSAGVMVLDADFRLVTCNDSVERILEHAGVTMVGQPLAQIEGLQQFAGAVINAFSAQSAQTAAGRNLNRLHWQQQIEIPRRAGGAGGADEQDITLLARGSRLPLETGSGYIVVFDDISDVISAQRSIAWGEVARRLAHEIKNPLTPIQLSAERLQMKLEDKLDAPEAQLLNRATTTIVNQVAAMKRMVDDFRDYARTPPAVLQPLDLNELVEEILHLYLGGDDGDIIHPQLGHGLPAVMGDATQLRQVIHNLLQNAQDAMADRAGAAAAHPRIDVTTEAIHYRGADGAVNTAVRLAISDNGPGFAPKILARAFEPYVTSKARGTGLGLAMVKKIIDEHSGRIDIQNHADGSGASIVILLLKLAPATTLAAATSAR